MKNIYHKIKRYEQTGVNCGPNSLAQLLSFYDDNTTPDELVAQTNMLKNLGTYDANLGVTTIKLGYKTKITPHNLYTFDPNWYKFSKKKLISKLEKELPKTKKKDLRHNIKGFIEFLKLGGEIDFQPISKDLLIKKLRKYPVLIGLSSTYLYRHDNERTGPKCRFGHFVIVNGYDPSSDKFFITDPWHSIPLSKTGRYKVKSDELIAAIYLGEATYDCTILEIWK